MRAKPSLAPGFLPRLASTLTRTWALALLWLVVAIYATRFALFKLPVPPYYTDFNQYYVAALSARMGADPYLNNVDPVAHANKLAIIDHRSNQTPTLLLSVEPLTRFNPYIAYWIWTGMSAAALVIALCLLMSQTSLTTRQALLFSALFLLYPPVYEHFYFANAQILITLLLVMTIYC